MALKFINECIFNTISYVDAIVNPVNCVGVSGKGLALAFKNKFPTNYKKYKKHCLMGKIKPGETFTTKTDFGYIVNFATKDHWRNPSKEEWIANGLELLHRKLIKSLKHRPVKSIAFPMLGAGLGGLDFETVKNIFTIEFENSIINVLVCDRR